VRSSVGERQIAACRLAHAYFLHIFTFNLQPIITLEVDARARRARPISFSAGRLCAAFCANALKQN
jgi:hypothetical protein